MAKGLGLIGNFRGKFGNAVGYNLKDSNNKQTQGIRIYQPIVKNPKTYAQAEQRARMAPINATYRLLKSVIDRGQEGVAYGNKSRLAWLRDAMKSFNGGWIPKGTSITWPALVPLTKGSLPVDFRAAATDLGLEITVPYDSGEPVNTMGKLSAALIAAYPGLKVGDQITMVVCQTSSATMSAFVDSIVLVDATDATALPSLLTFEDGLLSYRSDVDAIAGAVIASREGDGGQHLRSTAVLLQGRDYRAEYVSPEGKDTAIRSYMAAGTTTDWPQEPIED